MRRVILTALLMGLVTLGLAQAGTSNLPPAPAQSPTDLAASRSTDLDRSVPLQITRRTGQLLLLQVGATEQTPSQPSRRDPLAEGKAYYQARRRAAVLWLALVNALVFFLCLARLKLRHGSVRPAADEGSGKTSHVPPRPSPRLQFLHDHIVSANRRVRTPLMLLASVGLGAAATALVFWGLVFLYIPKDWYYDPDLSALPAIVVAALSVGGLSIGALLRRLSGARLPLLHLVGALIAIALIRPGIPMYVLVAYIPYGGVMVGAYGSSGVMRLRKTVQPVD
jgi:hypothetical protein